MKTTIKKIAQSVRRVMTRASSLLMLFQKTPLMQMLLPEAQLLGNAHVLNATAVTIATIAGLGAYDSVSGATAVSQTSPSSGSATVSATSGKNLNFLVQIVGAGGHTPASWSVVGTLPTGLTHANAKNSKTDSISGIPTQSGSFPITIKAWENSNFSGRSASGSFTINVAAPAGLVFASQPASVSINTGTSTTLQVTVTGGTGISYQWYQGNTGVTTSPVGTNSRTFTTPVLNASTNYWVKASNATFPNGTNSATATVTVLTPVAITSPPASTTILGGNSTTLSVAASGTGPITYQWYRGVSGNTTNPVGTNSSSFTTPVLTDSESYWVKVTNAATPAGVSSPTAVITVNQVARISMQPLATQTIISGETTTLTVSAIGTGPLVYQWYQGATGDKSTPVGTDSNSFTTPALTANTSYWVQVSNQFAPDGVNSTTANVAVNQPAMITTQPSSSSVVSGGKTTLSVVVAGTAPFTYQWFQGALGDISLPVGKGTSTFATAALKTTTSFWVRVSNAVAPAGVASEAAIVSVLNPVVITTQPLPGVVVSGGTTTLNVVATGSGPISYQWYEGKAGVITKPVGLNSASFETPALTANTMYWVKVSNPVSAGINSKPAIVTVNVPASIVTHPANATIKTGASAKLSVVAAGTAKFTYQWYQGESGDTSLPVGKPTAAFATPKLTATTKYWVKVMNAVNPAGAFSQTATVTVGNPAAIATQPVSLTINAGETTTLSVAATGLEPMTYQWYQGKSGVVTTPVGANEATFTTPALTATTMYWVKVSNPLLPAGVKSLSATVTVTPAAMAAKSTTQLTGSRYQAWADSQFTSDQLLDTNLTAPTADADGDGVSNADERIFGSSPVQAQSALLSIQLQQEQMVLSFMAMSTKDSSDDSAERHYAIETCTDLSAGEWQLLDGSNDFIGNDELVQRAVPLSNEKAFYRLKAWLK